MNTFMLKEAKEIGELSSSSLSSGQLFNNWVITFLELETGNKIVCKDITIKSFFLGESSVILVDIFKYNYYSKTGNVLPYSELENSEEVEGELTSKLNSVIEMLLETNCVFMEDYLIL